MMLKSNRQLIAIDLGGVIQDTWPAKRSWLRRKFVCLEASLPRRELQRVLGREAHREMLSDVYDLEPEDHPPVNGAAAALAMLAEQFEIVILTSRSTARLDSTRGWLERNSLSFLRGRIQTIVGAVAESAKLAWCRAVGACVLIDDDADRFLDPFASDVGQIHFSPSHREFRRLSPWFCRATEWGDVPPAVRHFINESEFRRSQERLAKISRQTGGHTDGEGLGRRLNCRVQDTETCVLYHSSTRSAGAFSCSRSLAVMRQVHTALLSNLAAMKMTGIVDTVRGHCRGRRTAALSRADRDSRSGLRRGISLRASEEALARNKRRDQAERKGISLPTS